MAEMPPIALAHPGALIAAVFTPWIALGIALLIGFFATYLTALSWADLTFVLPATAFGNVIVALLARFWLHEAISLERWAGILLITLGVGFVAQGPSLTRHPAPEESEATRGGSEDDRQLCPRPSNPWIATAMIAAVVLTSTTGEVLTAAAMKSIGDLDVIRARSGPEGRDPRRANLSAFLCRSFLPGFGLLLPALALNHLNLSLVAPASASLTLVTNAMAGKIFLKENVDRRRWAAAVLVCVGVYLLAH